MRIAILVGALIAACCGGSEPRDARQPQPPSEAEETDGFTHEQREALSELLHEDVTEGAAGSKAGPGP
jgi:hypothetical protein